MTRHADWDATAEVAPSQADAKGLPVKLEKGDQKVLPCAGSRIQSQDLKEKTKEPTS
jgi:hypothetical protein